MLISDIKDHKDCFYIDSDNSDEYLYNLEEYLIDLLIGNKVEMYFKPFYIRCISKKNNIILSLRITSKYDYDEKFIDFKQKLKSKREMIIKIKDHIKLYDDVLNKIKDYKSQDILDYLNIMSQLARLSKSSKEQINVKIKLI